MDDIEAAKAYLQPIEETLELSSGIRYVAIFFNPDPDALKERPELFPIARAAYTLSIVERSHFAAIATLARTHRWLTGAIDQRENGNLLAFSAALRGLLEACADSYDALKFLPKALLDGRERLYRTLHSPESTKEILLMKDLEERLIHFGFARKQKKGSSAPKEHNAKPNTTYIREIEAFGVPKAIDLYAELCELTHPASPSVDCFVDQSPHSYTLNFVRDTAEIESIISRYSGTILNLAMFTLNPALICLHFISRLIPEWPSPAPEYFAQVPFAKNAAQFDDLASSIGAPRSIDAFQQLLLLLMGAEDSNTSHDLSPDAFA
ncbi:hypothetical protein [Stenotrophomonas lactitubi]|uniref:hypothetical protein n=1 Tax=Stenotrophomonas lactitubi TaxID=2045214 RepID=UPI0032088A18